MLFRWSGFSAKVSKGDTRMIENRIFWVIMAAVSLVVLVFIIELFIMFYLYL